MSKGGSSKSTTSVNLAAGFAQAGWRTLIVDVDPQSNATERFECEDAEADLYSVLVDDVPIDKAIQYERRLNLDVLPSSLYVAQIDTWLMQQYHREARVRRALNPVLEDYDAVVLDLPPTLGQLVISSLAAADSLIVPTDSSKWGWKGVELYLSWIDELRQAEVVHAELLGVVHARWEPNTIASRRTGERLAESGLPAFETRIPKRVAAERMSDLHLVLGDEGSDEDLDVAHAALTVEVMRRIRERRERDGGRHRG